MNESKPVLITRDEWLKLPPKAQGYAWYMQAELPGSELKLEKNPYATGTSKHQWFEDGVQRGVLEAQDSEE